MACVEACEGAGDQCTAEEIYTQMGSCLPDPPADSACTADEVATTLAAAEADPEHPDPEEISEGCVGCIMTRTWRKGAPGPAVATSDVVLCGPPAAGSKDSSCYEGVVGACSDPMQRIDCSEAGQRQFMATQFGETGEHAANWRGRVAICCALPVAIDCSSPAVRQMVAVCDTMGVRNCTC